MRNSPGSPDRASIAVLIPCYNEAQTVGAVVRAFRAVLPDPDIYVYDNNSTDQTRARAEEAGAKVRSETMQGKGWVVRRMFADIEADYYILVDGDGTYDALSAPPMIAAIRDRQLAMVVGRRVHETSSAYRTGHRIGNRLFTKSIGWIFGSAFTDILSGYRAFSRAFVKSFPLFTGGFEVETELTVHALTLKLPVAEIPTSYKERPRGSSSKLHTFRDGFRILHAILTLFKNERPLLFFGLIGVLCLSTAVVLAYPVLLTYLKTGLVPRFPTAILATALATYGLIMFACGLILDTVAKGRREAKLLAYLQGSSGGGGAHPRPAQSSRTAG